MIDDVLTRADTFVAAMDSTGREADRLLANLVRELAKAARDVRSPVFLAVCTYDYEDEHGGVTHGVFSSGEKARAYADTRTTEGGPYTWNVEQWDVDNPRTPPRRGGESR